MTGPALADLDGSDFDHGRDLVADRPADASQLRLIPLVLLEALTVEARKSLVEAGMADGLLHRLDAITRWHENHPGMSRLLHLTDL